MSHPSVVRHPAAPKRHRVSTRLICAGALVAALAFSLASLALAVDGSFSDVPTSHVYYTAINHLASEGVIGGYEDGSFGPEKPVTRQQFAKMIVRAGGYPVSEADVCTFVDVETSGPGELFPDNYVAVCAANGITQGKTVTSFDPYNLVTRYQVITMVVRAADDLAPDPLASPPSGWSPTGAWGNDPIHGANAARAEYNGILDGLDLGLLSPTASMSRGEAAQILYNLRTKILDLSSTLPSATTSTSAGSSTTLPRYTLTVVPSPDWAGSVTRSPDQDTYVAGSSVVLTAEPVLWGAYTWFDSWLGDAGGDANPITIVMDSNKTVVALFGYATPAYGLTVTVPGGHGTVTRQPNQTHYNAGATVRLTATPDAGYKFAGWGGDAAGLGANPLNVYMSSNKSITALFVPITTYSLTTSVAGNVGGTISRSPNQTTYAPGSTVQLLGVPSTGYYLHHWSGDASGTANPVTVTMNSNKAVTAYFAPKTTYTLTVTAPNGHGSVTRTPSKSAYYSGESVVLTPVPSSGYIFDHWGGSASGSTYPLTVVMNSNKTISAYFVIFH